MRTKRLVVLLAVLAVCLFGFRSEYMLMTAEKTADSAAVTGAGYFYGITVTTDGTNAVTMDVYDNTAASGTKLIQTVVFPTSAMARGGAIGWDPPLPFNTGVYVDVTVGGGGTVKYMVYYRLQ